MPSSKLQNFAPQFMLPAVDVRAVKPSLLEWAATSPLMTFGEAREQYLALSLLPNASRYCIEANLKYTLLIVVAELVPECRMGFYPLFPYNYIQCDRRKKHDILYA
jgi:hypothetical protein